MIIQDLKHLAKDNTNFRKVMYTGPNAQTVIMSLKPGEDIGEEVHEAIDQLFFFIKGEAEVIINNQLTKVVKHDFAYVPKGSRHNIKNTGMEDLKLITIYTPPAHKDGTLQATKEEAEKEHEGY